MKKIFLAGCLILPVWIFGASSHDEVGGNIGVTSIYNENGIELDNFSAGVNYQINKYIIKPRFDFDYVKINDFKDVSYLLKGSVNAVYEYDTGSNFTPYVLGGAGYEYVDQDEKVFDSNLFVQGGAGVSYEVGNGIKAKMEGKVLQIIGGDNGQDNEIMLTAGVSFPLGQRKVKEVPVIEKLNENCPIKIDAPDEDRDGIADNNDQCPNTPCGYTVDTFGCTTKAILQIHFGVNSSYVTEYSMPKVRRFANFLKRRKGTSVKIVGHTDSDGTTESNLLLSQRRAAAVVVKLISLGISPSRLSSQGFGEGQPISTNDTKEGKALNRRIEAKLTYPIDIRR